MTANGNANRGSITGTFLAASLRVCLGAAIISICAGLNLAHAQTEDAVVAVVNNRNITQREVDQSIFPQLLPLQEQVYALRKTALENLVTRSILEDAARKAGVSVDELKKQLTSGRVEVPANQVQEVYAENASVFGAMNPDEAKERLRLDLESQARMKLYRDALAELRKSSRIEVRLIEPRLPSVDDGTSPSTGSQDAAITIVEFSDFQCSYCRGSQRMLKQIMQAFGNDVRLVFKHLPLDIHAEAFASAQAAYCAGAQGSFWQYHDALFTSADLSAQTLNKIASDLNLNVPKFQACLSSDVSRAAVLKDVQAARQFGISSTPTFIINGKLVRGAVGFDDFKAKVESELKTSRDTSGTKLP